MRGAGRPNESIRFMMNEFRADISVSRTVFYDLSHDIIMSKPFP